MTDEIWLIVPDEKLDDLAAINALQFVDGYPSKVCTTKDDINGLHLTGADKLGDPYWSDYHAFLSELEVFDGTPTWPAPPEGR